MQAFLRLAGVAVVFADRPQRFAESGIDRQRTFERRKSELDKIEIEIEPAEIVEIDRIFGLGFDRGFEMLDSLAACTKLDIDDAHNIVNVGTLRMSLEQCEANLFGFGLFALLDERCDLPDFDVHRVEGTG